MPKIKLNPAISSISGSLGDIVFRRAGNGYVIICRKPDMSHVVHSPAQLAHQQRFRLAVHYAKGVFSDPERSCPYRQAGGSVYQRALADYMHPPVVEALDLTGYTGRPGDPLLVRARDDFEVVAVQLCLLDAAGTEIEQGPALRDPAGGNWLYLAHAPVAPGSLVRVRATATDRPGNSATLLAEKNL